MQLVVIKDWIFVPDGEERNTANFLGVKCHGVDVAPFLNLLQTTLKIHTVIKSGYFLEKLNVVNKQEAV